MDKYPQMLFRIGGEMRYEGSTFDTLVVGSDEECESAIDAGWHETTAGAVHASSEPKPAAVPEPVIVNRDPQPAEPTRPELEAEAKRLGIRFDGRTGDKKLASLIADKKA